MLNWSSLSTNAKILIIMIVSIIAIHLLNIPEGFVVSIVALIFGWKIFRCTIVYLMIRSDDAEIDEPAYSTTSAILKDMAVDVVTTVLMFFIFGFGMAAVVAIYHIMNWTNYNLAIKKYKLGL